MIYIFSNVYKYENNDNKFIENLNKFNFLNLKFLFLNRCIPFIHGKEFFKDKQNYAYLNTDSVQQTAFGFLTCLDNIKLFKEVIFQNYSLIDNKITFKNFGDYINKQQKNESNINYLIPKHDKSKPFTAGFHSYFLARAYFKEDVTLVNFYGNKDNSTQKVKCHDWNFEDSFLNKHANKIFI